MLGLYIIEPCPSRKIFANKEDAIKSRGTDDVVVPISDTSPNGYWELMPAAVYVRERYGSSRLPERGHPDCSNPLYTYLSARDFSRRALYTDIRQSAQHVSRNA